MKADLHPKLAGISAALHGRLPEVTEEILGTKYTLRLLKPEADDWVAARTDGATAAAVMLNARKPVIAAALTTIDIGDGEGPAMVEQLFPLPKDMEPTVKEFLMQDTRALRDWRRGEILAWLKDGLDTYVIDRLFDVYTSMLLKHKKDLTALENFSKRTPSDG